MKHIERMFANGFQHGLIGIIAPCSGGELMVGVGEEIRVMDIDHDPLSGFGSPFRQIEHVLFVTPSGTVVHPYA